MPANRPTRLDRPTVVDAAIALADRDGIDALSMRRLGQAVGVEAMSLYGHVRGRDDLVDAMVEALVARVGVARRRDGWRASLRATILDARGVMRPHPWVRVALASRWTPGPATVAYLDALGRLLRDAGFGAELVARALGALGCRALGVDDATSGDPADDDAFVFGVDLILDGLERERARAARPTVPGRDGGDWRMW